MRPERLTTPHRDPSRSPRLEIEHYQGCGGLRDVETHWRRIIERLPSPAFYQRYEWHRSHAEATDGKHLHWLVARRGDIPLAICPLRLNRKRITGVPVRILDQPDLGYVPNDFVWDPVADRRVLGAVLSYLQSESAPSYDLLLLRRVRADSRLFAFLVDRWNRFVAVDPAYCSAAIGCTRPFDALIRDLPRKRRWNLKTAERRLEELPEARVTTTISPPWLPNALERFLTVEASGWKGASGTRTAVLANPTRRRVFDALVRNFGERGGCRIDLLWTEDRCIAAAFCLASGSTLSLLKIAYDESYARVSPGHVLFAKILRRCTSSHFIQTFDIITDPHWTSAWHPSRTETYDVYVCNRRLRSLPAWTAARIARTAAHVIGQ